MTKCPQWNRFPFDSKNPIGYLVGVLLEMPIAIFSLRYLASNLSMAFSGFLFALSISKDIKNTLSLIDVRVKANKTPSRIICKQMCKLIHFTALKPSVKFMLFQNIFLIRKWKWVRWDLTIQRFFIFRILNRFLDVYQISVTILFLGCTGLISLSLLLIQMEIVQVISLLFFRLLFILRRKA